MDVISAQKMFGYTLILANKIQSMGDGLIKEFSLKQWFLLITVKNMPGESPNVNEIAEVSGTSRQNVRKMLEILSRKGYVSLGASRSDARALTVSLTQRAVEYLSQNERYGEELTEKLFCGIDDASIWNTLEVYEKMLENIEGMVKSYEKA